MISIFDIFGVKIKSLFCRNVLKRIIDKLRDIFMNQAAVRFSPIGKANQHILCLFVVSDFKAHMSKVMGFKFINHFQIPEIVSGTIILGLNRARVNNRLLLSFCNLNKEC